MQRDEEFRAEFYGKCQTCLRREHGELIRGYSCPECGMPDCREDFEDEAE